MRFAFFRPDDHHYEYFDFLSGVPLIKIWSLGKAVRTGTASRGIREKNVKVAVLRRSYLDMV